MENKKFFFKVLCHLNLFLLGSGYSGDYGSGYSGIGDFFDNFDWDFLFRNVGKYGCKEAYKVAHWIAPPYTIKRESGHIEGLLPDLLKEAVSRCCEADVTVVFPTFNRYQGNQDMLSLWENESFAFPVFRTSQQQLFEPHDHFTFYPVIETNGVVLLKNSDANTKTMDVLNALLGCWPLLAIVVLAAAFAGIIMWGLDTFKNPDDFPRKFPIGCWEGFWWAFVTMSTVGYGDKVPKSILGRLFSIPWILIGMILLSLFTAALTTALAAGQIEANNIKGKEIGVLKYSMEYRKALSMGSIPIEFQDRNEMFKALSKGVLFGCLLEQYSWLYESRRGNAIPSNVYWASEFSERGYIGILAPKGEDTLFPSERSNCLSKSILKNRYSVSSTFEQRVLKEKNHGESTGSDTTTDIFKGLSNIGLVIGFGVWLLLYCIILGIYWILASIKKKNVTIDILKDKI